VLEAEAQADAYLLLTEQTRAAGPAAPGLNFARPGAESSQPRLLATPPVPGAGPSAHGLRTGARYANLWSLERWAEAWNGLAPEERSRNPPQSRAGEIVMLALRLGTGLMPDDYDASVWSEVRHGYGTALENAVRGGRLSAGRAATGSGPSIVSWPTA
jgi:coproporphyrinogen III oxidase-like Fe-S oxidoreductase